jgi:hypothetical protein
MNRNQWGRRPRGLAHHGNPPGWLEEIYPGCYFVHDRLSVSMPPALTDHTTCLCLELIYYKMYTKHRHELRHAKKEWPGTLVDLYLLSDGNCAFCTYIFEVLRSCNKAPLGSILLGQAPLETLRWYAAIRKAGEVLSCRVKSIQKQAI